MYGLAQLCLRFTAVLFLTLAVLNVGVGGVVTLDTDPLGTQEEGGSVEAGNKLLHLQLFGLIHLHENTAEEHSHQLKPPPGVVEYDTTDQSQASSFYLASGPDPRTGLSIHSGNYGAGWGQNIISDYLHSSISPYANLLDLKDRLLPPGERRLTGPFIPVPQKPPTF